MSPEASGRFPSYGDPTSPKIKATRPNRASQISHSWTLHVYPSVMLAWWRWSWDALIGQNGVGHDQHGLRLENKFPRDSHSCLKKAETHWEHCNLSRVRDPIVVPNPQLQWLFPAVLGHVFKSQGRQLDWIFSEAAVISPSATCSHHQAMYHEMKLHSDLQKTTTLPQIK